MENDTLGGTILRPHRMLEKTINGQQVYAINFTESEFSGIIFSYDRVEFIEDEENDRLITKFNYVIHQNDDENFDRKKFENELGDFLIEMICDGLLKREIIYGGGTDENRENDITPVNHE